VTAPTLLERALTSCDALLDGKTVVVWGPSFKPKTDDMREAHWLVLVEGLHRKGARLYGDNLQPTRPRGLCSETGSSTPPTPYATLDGAGPLIVVKEWIDFPFPDFHRIKAAMRSPVVFDGRNHWEPTKMRGCSHTRDREALAREAGA
jgi:UDPglucose 6-dehydrogenase